MNKELKDRDVLRLLTRLKNVEVGYPTDAMTTRREAYIKQAAAVAALIQARENDLNARGDGNSPGGGGAGAASSSMTMWLEAALVTVIVVEAGIATYIHREKIADFIDSALFPNKVEHVSNPPDESPSLPVVIPITGKETEAATPVPAFTFTVTVSATGASATTLTPEAAEAVINETNEEGAAEVLSTPAPGDNPGLHLGQTPKPERTLPSNDEKPSNDGKQPNENKPPSNGGGNK